MRCLFLLVGCALSVLPAWALGCNNNGALPEPTSDKEADDPCDPGGGSQQQTGSAPPVDAGSTPVLLPGGSAGVGFDDMRFSATLAQLLVPAGRTGDLDLIDPSTELITSVAGFSAEATYSGDSTFGVTSADEGNDVIYATDRTSSTLASINPAVKMIGATLKLASTPGYVRYVSTTSEIWVSEPDAKQVEVVAPTGADGGAGLSHVMNIGVAGAESLEVDDTNALAFTNAPTSTVAIDIETHKVSGTWPNGCTTAKGLAVDPLHGFVLVACNEGKLVVLNEQSGAMLGSVNTGAGVDRIAYDIQRSRAYVPSPAAAAMDVIVLSAKGVPTLAGSVLATPDAHCAVTPGAGEVFVCSPARGEVVFLFDPF
jgi:hypothetical protein